MKNECSVIKDLLPLYAEDMTSPETAEAIKEHISGCSECRAALAELAPKQEAPDDSSAALPLKAVKKKLAIKRILIAACAVLATLGLIFAVKGIVDSRPVKVNYGDSKLYSAEDLKKASAAVITDFNDWGGRRKLYSLTYAGDEVCEHELAYIKDLGDYDECVVFGSVFRAPIFGAGFPKSSVYTWSWYLGRKDGGEWEIVTRGY